MSGDAAGLTAIGLIVVGVSLAGLVLVNRWLRDYRSLGPTNRRVRAESGLTRREWRSLERLARHAGVQPVASLVISRGCFQHALSRAPKCSADPRVQAVAARLFDDPR